MKKTNLKKLLAAVIALVTVLCIPTGAFAAEAESSSPHQITIYYDADLYSVTANGTVLTDRKTELSGDQCSLTVQYVGDASDFYSGSKCAKVYVNGVLTADITETLYWTGTIDKDSIICVAERATSMGDAPAQSTNPDYGKSWSFVYPEGYTNLIPSGCDYTFGIQVAKGYRNSDFEVYGEYQNPRGSEGRAGAMWSDVFCISKDKENGLYYFKLTNIGYVQKIRVGSAYTRIPASMQLLTPDTYTVTYYMDDSAEAEVYTTQNVEMDTKASKPSTPAKTGYSFVQWVTEDGTAYDFNNAVSGDMKLYAQWEKQIAITYNLYDGKTEMRYVDKGDEAENFVPTRSGYAFDSWYSDAACTEKFDFGTEINEDTTLYAKWLPAISSCTVSSISNKVYTGSNITPVVTVKNGTKTLVKGTDYTVSYSNNKAVGKATITIKGAGEYGGTKTVTFKIIPKATKIKSGKALSGKKIKITWAKQSGATSYILYRSTSASKNYKAVKTLSSSKSSYTNTGLKAKKYYYYKIRVVKKVNGVNYYSNFSGYKKVKAKK